MKHSFTLLGTRSGTGIVAGGLIGLLLVAEGSPLVGISRAAGTANAPPQQVVLRGVVRDFRPDHPDFDLGDPSQYGHYAGNVAPLLSISNRPLFTNSGRNVFEQFHDLDGNVIMPYGDGGLVGGHFDVDVYDAPTDQELYHKHQYDDTFDTTTIDIANSVELLFRDVCAGYPNPLRAVIINPHNSGIGQFVFEANGVVQSGLIADGISGTFLADDVSRFRVSFQTLNAMRGTDPGTAQRDIIDRDDSFGIRLFDAVTGELVYEIDTYHHIQGGGGGGGGGGHGGGGGGDGDHDGHGDHDGDGDHDGHGDHDGDDDHDGHGDHDGDDDDDANGNNGNDWQYYTPPNRNDVDSCGDPIADISGTLAAPGSGAVSSQISFDQWFRYVPGENLETPHNIIMTRDPHGVYEFTTNSFYPIDEEDLYGREDDGHNHFFTYAIESIATYVACQDLFIEAKASDDLWIFINGELVIDAGGVDTPSGQYVSLDRLGLVDGESFTMNIFFAQRLESVESELTVRTNIPFEARQATVPTMASFD